MKNNVYILVAALLLAGSGMIESAARGGKSQAIFNRYKKISDDFKKAVAADDFVQAASLLNSAPADVKNLYKKELSSLQQRLKDSQAKFAARRIPAAGAGGAARAVPAGVVPRGQRIPLARLGEIELGALATFKAELIEDYLVKTTEELQDIIDSAKATIKKLQGEAFTAEIAQRIKEEQAKLSTAKQYLNPATRQNELQARLGLAEKRLGELQAAGEAEEVQEEIAELRSFMEKAIATLGELGEGDEGEAEGDERPEEEGAAE